MHKLWKSWTINCAIGELLGIASAAVIAFFADELMHEPQSISSKSFLLIVMMFAGFIEGSILSHFQWKSLVTKLKDVPFKQWYLFTVLIAVIGWFLGMLPSLFFMPESSSDIESFTPDNLPSPYFYITMAIFSGFGLGALFGLFQWMVLRKHVHRAYEWIIANSIGWGLGLLWIYLFASIPDESSNILFIVTMGVIGGSLAGLSVGAITGISLARFEKK